MARYGIETPEMRHWASTYACKVVLERLQKSGMLYAFRLVPDNSPLDMMGIDVRLIMKRLDGSVYEIPLQIKSSMDMVVKHYAYPNQWIDAVCNEQGHDIEAQIVAILNKHIKADHYLHVKQKADKLRQTRAKRKAAGVIYKKTGRPPKSKPPKINPNNEEAASLARERVEKYFELNPNSSVNAAAATLRASKTTVQKYRPR